MKQLIECVPNFSEGRRQEVIEQLVRSIAETGEVTILDRHCDPDHNRSVITYVCPPESVIDSALAGYRTAVQHIDLTQHRGVHPRIGACDVFPLVALKNVTIDEAIRLSQDLGKKVGNELHIPVYLYEKSATQPSRENLANIRRGEFEGFNRKIESDQSFQPDYGSSFVHPTAGATAIGVRSILVAFNLFINSNDITIGRTIARTIRESDGGLKYVRALAFQIERRNQVQISMNLVHYAKVSMNQLLKTIEEEAMKYEAKIESAEFVGLVPCQVCKAVQNYGLPLENFSLEHILEEKLRPFDMIELPE